MNQFVLNPMQQHLNQRFLRYQLRSGQSRGTRKPLASRRKRKRHQFSTQSNNQTYSQTNKGT